MELYRIGKVVSIGKNWIILETYFIGQIIYVLNTLNFELNKIQKIYTYFYQNNYFCTMYGFINFKQRMMFKHLTKISGVGPRIAFNVMQIGIDKLIDLVNSNSVQELIIQSHLNENLVNKIISELKKHYPLKTSKVTLNHETIRESLKKLGFSNSQITYALDKLSLNDSLEAMIENAIKLIANVQLT